MDDFFAMGGYARFVWSAFGITAAIVALNIFAARRRFRRTRDAVAQRVQRQELRRNKA